MGHGVGGRPGTVALDSAALHPGYELLKKGGYIPHTPMSGEPTRSRRCQMRSSQLTPGRR